MFSLFRPFLLLPIIFIDDYRDLIGIELSHLDLKNFIKRIPGVWFDIDAKWREVYHVDSSRSKHITKMVKQQKPERFNNKPWYGKRNNNTNRQTLNNQWCKNGVQQQQQRTGMIPGIPGSYYDQPYQYEQQQQQQRYTQKSMKKNRWDHYTPYQEPSYQRHHYYFPNNAPCYYANSSFDSEYDYDGYLHDFQLLGDDFFLSVAHYELNYNFRPGHKVLQCGLCISGQTIADATRRVLNSSSINNSIVVNVGSVDLLHGRELIDIISDYMALLEAFNFRGIKPIITTLAPLANLSHAKHTRNNLTKFNEFLRGLSSDVSVIDLWQCMVDQHARTLYECYQLEARYVTGSCRPHVFWNKLGRQIVLKCLKKALTNIVY